MKMRTTVWLYVCLYVTLTAGAVSKLSAASPANSAGDVPAPVRSSNDINRKLDGPVVAKDDVQILERARSANEDVYSSLQSFVCDEQINRFRGSINAQSAHPLDTVTAKLSFERGVEEYTNVRQNDRPRPGMSSLPGAWSEGEFGTLLLQTQQLISTQKVEFDSFADVAGERAAIYRFDVDENESPWDLSVAGKHYRLPFRTDVWVSVNTGEILRIARTTTRIDPGTHISEIQWDISLNHFNISGKNWLLPATGTYAVVYGESHHREWNLISFTGYQRYTSQASVKFE